MSWIGWVEVATGFTGALTMVFVARTIYDWIWPPTAHKAHFSPKGGCTEAVVKEIQAARREILVLAYSFSSKPIADALLEAKVRGVHVEVILDKSNEQEQYTSLPELVRGGVPVLIDSHHAIAHNKVFLIDGHVLITGSFNFTHQAEIENGENLLVIKGHRDLIRSYRLNFEAHKEHSQTPGSKPAASAPGTKPAAAHGDHRRVA
jgi:phosphatidylserine/phosphatidylglycerophosphate/cardiolipin synthase-like enzyme